VGGRRQVSSHGRRRFIAVVAEFSWACLAAAGILNKGAASDVAACLTGIAQVLECPSHRRLCYADFLGKAGNRRQTVARVQFPKTNGLKDDVADLYIKGCVGFFVDAVGDHCRLLIVN